MAISLFTSAKWLGPTGGAGGTSASIDTTGAKLLVISVPHYFASGQVPSVVSDNKGNTWTPLTGHGAGSARHIFYYSIPTSVGTGHTFTVTGSAIYPQLSVLVYGAAGIVSFESENGATNFGGGSLATGPVTPTQNGSLVLSGWNGTNGNTNPTIDSGLTIRQSNNAIGNFCISGAVADLIQTTAAPINPTWSWTSGTDWIAESIAVFKEVITPAANIRVSQDVAEILTLPIPDIRVSQDAVEVLAAPIPQLRVTQVAVEILTGAVVVATVTETTRFQIILP